MDRMQKAQLIEAHRPHWSGTWVWLGFVAALVGVEGMLLGTLLWGPWWLAVLLVVLTAHLLHAHLIAFHEAAHRTLCPNRWWNEAIGHLIGVFSFMSLNLFRVVHHAHHAYLTTPRDEELWPFVDPRAPRWFRRLAAALELTLGLLYTPALFLRAFLRPGSTIQDRRLRRRIWRELLLAVLVWAGILTAVTRLGLWELFLGLFVAPAALAAVMQSCRKYIEHMGLTGATVLGATRTVLPTGPVGRWVAFSLFNIAYHGIHHRYAKVPQARLPAFTALLTRSEADEVPPYPSYRRALGAMVRSLSDPRIGAQWRRP
jgi:fatty acid desaturase